MSSLVRRFILRTREDDAQLYTFLKANREPMEKLGRFLQVTVAEYKTTRKQEANSAMWASILEPMAQQAWVAGRQFSAVVWHEQMKREFLPEVNSKGQPKWEILPNGERQLIMSTTQLNTAEFSDYMIQLSAYASTELGVKLPANPRDSDSY